MAWISLPVGRRARRRRGSGRTLGDGSEPCNAQHSAVLHFEHGEKGGDAAALGVVGHGAAVPGLERQARLGVVKRLDLALFVNRQHDGVHRRSQDEVDHIPRPSRQKRGRWSA